MKGYKVTNSDYTCKGVKFEVGQTYTIDAAPIMCEHGYHFCEKVADCFKYYSFDPNNKVFEVEATGDVVKGADKHVTNALLIVRELTWSEMLVLANEGKGNAGLRNTGNRNTGNSNTGDWNTGNRNTGNWNTGDCNTGNRNTGNSNTGDWDTGNRNTGNSNTGNSNTGNRNTGNRNTGNSNTGNSNTGDWNTGNRNTGNRNSGYYNSGDYNSGNYHTGAFCTGDAEFKLFNKPTTMTRREFYNSRAWGVLFAFSPVKWVEDKDSVTGGEYVSVPYKDAFVEFWIKLSDNDKQSVKDLPNFDADVFFEITGVRV